MKIGTCVECNKSAKSSTSYFCSDCLFKESVKKAVTQ